jgi:hypothetical protein
MLPKDVMRLAAIAENASGMRAFYELMGISREVTERAIEVAARHRVQTPHSIETPTIKKKSARKRDVGGRLRQPVRM